MTLLSRLKQRHLRKKLYKEMRKSPKVVKYAFPGTFHSLTWDVYAPLVIPARMFFDIAPEILPNALKRLRIVENEYVAIRGLDNGFDREGIQEENYDPTVHIMHIQNILRGKEEPHNALEKSLLLNRRDAKHLGGNAAQTLEEATESLIASWQFDIGRVDSFHKKGTIQVYPQKELERYFIDMEVNGIMKGFLGIMGEENSLHKVTPLVKAARKSFYFIRDLAEDIADGRVNVPAEYIGEYSIPELHALQLHCENYRDHNYQWGIFNPRSFTTFYEGLPQEVKKWMSDELKEGIALMYQHDEENPLNDMGRITKKLINSMYVGETKLMLSWYACMWDIDDCTLESQSLSEHTAMLFTIGNQVSYATKKFVKNEFKRFVEPLTNSW